MKPCAYLLIEPEAAPDEPVTLTQAKQHLKVDVSEDDAYITSLITAGREFCEEHCGRSFVDQSWQLGYGGWPAPHQWSPSYFRGEFDLARPPVRSVTSVKYRAASDGTLTTLDPSYYTFDPDVLPGIVRMNRSLTFPSLSLNYTAPIQIVIVTGPEDASEALAVPERVRLALLQMITQFYENRVPVVQGTIAQNVPLTALALLERLKIRKV